MYRFAIFFSSLTLNLVYFAQVDSLFEVFPLQFSDALYDLPVNRNAMAATVSDGYVVRYNAVTGENTGTHPAFFSTPNLVKLDTEGEVVAEFDLSVLSDSLYGADPVRVVNDTVCVPLNTGIGRKGAPWLHLAYARFDKDLNLIDFAQHNNAFHGEQYNRNSVGASVIDAKTMIRVNNGPYVTDGGGYDGLYVHKLRASGEYESQRLVEPYPLFVNQVTTHKDRVLVVGQGAFLAMDTSYNITLSARTFLENDAPPVYSSVLGGKSARGKIVGKSYYFFNEAHCGSAPNRTQNCVAAQKYDDNGLVLQRELWRAPGSRRQTETGYAPTQRNDGMIYDGDSTIYAIHERLRSEQPDEFPPAWIIRAVDTNLNLLWKKTYLLPEDNYGLEDIALSPDGKSLLVFGRTYQPVYYEAAKLPNFLVSTVNGEVTNVNDIALVEEADFAYPSLTRGPLTVDAAYASHINALELINLGDGRREPLSYAGADVDLSGVPSGTYLLRARRNDGAPVLQQRIVVAR